MRIVYILVALYADGSTSTVTFAHWSECDAAARAVVLTDFETLERDEADAVLMPQCARLMRTDR